MFTLKALILMGILFPVLAEEIPSDEDEVNENRNAMQQQSGAPACQGGEEDDDDEDGDDYWDDGFEGTPLEEYSTPLDYDNGEDEYQFFTSALLSESSFRCLTAIKVIKAEDQFYRHMQLASTVRPTKSSISDFLCAYHRNCLS